MTEQILTYCLLALAGIANAVMDILQFNFQKSFFSSMKTPEFLKKLLKIENFFDTKIAWQNCYKNNNYNEGEKFFLSSSSFRFIFDAWHFSQFIMLSCFYVIIIMNHVFIHAAIDFIIYHIIFGSIFTAFYHSILRKETYQ